jgi:hypothetical protein
LFWTIWHALGVATVVSVPAFYVWGETVAGLQPDALLQAVAMGAAYLALATVVALVRPGRSPRGILDVVVAGGVTFGAALVLLALRPDLTPSRAFVVFSALLATALVLLPIVLHRCLERPAAVGSHSPAGGLSGAVTQQSAVCDRLRAGALREVRPECVDLDAAKGRRE